MGKQRVVMMDIRVAVKSDFADQLGKKKIGAMYFQQSISGGFCKQPYYLSENTNLETFKELFKTNQIWVPVGIFEEVTILEYEPENY